MPNGVLAAVGMSNKVIAPAVVTRPILLEAVVNQRAPSEPAAMCAGVPSAGNSMIAPDVVIRPIRLPSASANQSAPSGPAAMP
jgi:hypothetical protein